MSLALVRKLFEARVEEWAQTQIPKIPVSYENVEFKPPVGSTWAKVTIIPADTESQYLDESDRIYRGVLFINIFTKKGVGSGLINTIVESLEAEFPLGLKLNSGNFLLRVVTPTSVRQPIPEELFVNTPVFLNYQASLNWA
jgi:hypothetical protein